MSHWIKVAVSNCLVQSRLHIKAVTEFCNLIGKFTIYIYSTGLLEAKEIVAALLVYDVFLTNKIIYGIRNGLNIVFYRIDITDSFKCGCYPFKLRNTVNDSYCLYNIRLKVCFGLIQKFRRQIIGLMKL